jgi:hypothetical protein
MTRDTPSADEVVEGIKQHGPQPVWKLATILRPQA